MGPEEVGHSRAQRLGQWRVSGCWRGCCLQGYCLRCHAIGFHPFEDQFRVLQATRSWQYLDRAVGQERSALPATAAPIDGVHHGCDDVAETQARRCLKGTQGCGYTDGHIVAEIVVIHGCGSSTTACAVNEIARRSRDRAPPHAGWFRSPIRRWRRVRRAARGSCPWRAQRRRATRCSTCSRW